MSTHRRLIETRLALAAACLAVLSVGSMGGCSGDSQEAERVSLPVVVDASHVAPVETDLFWQVELTTFRASIADVEFTTEGELHGARSPLPSWLVGPAYAHPGHYAGGEVIGEMPGRFVVDWTDDGAALATASLIVGDYTGANFRFATASTDDGLADDDPLVGHSVHLAGTARRAGDEVDFEALVTYGDDQRVIGAPFGAAIGEGLEETGTTLGLRVHPADPEEGDTLFDGVDFGALEDGGDGRAVFEAGSPAYNRLRRALQVHDHYSVIRHQR